MFILRIVSILLFCHLFTACYREAYSYRLRHPILENQSVRLISKDYIRYYEFSDPEETSIKGMLGKTYGNLKDDPSIVIKPEQKIELIGYRFSSVIPFWIDCSYIARVNGPDYIIHLDPSDWLSIKIGDKTLSGKDDFKKYKLWPCDQRPHIYSYYWILGDLLYLFYNDDVFNDVVSK